MTSFQYLSRTWIGLPMVSLAFLFVCALQASAYSPNQGVHSAHNIPHLDQNFHEDNQSQFHFDRDYLVSLIVFPSIMLGAGLISVLIFAVLWLFRCIFIGCCGCCRCLLCLPTIGAPVPKSRRRIIGFFLASLFVCILAVQVLPPTNGYINDGVRSEARAFIDVNDIFTEVIDFTNTIKSDASSIQTIVDNDACVQTAISTPSPIQSSARQTYNTFNTAVDRLESVVSDVNSILSKITDYILYARSKLLYYGISQKTIGVFSVYGGIMGLIVVYFLCWMYLRSQIIARIIIFVTLLVVLLLTLIIFVETILVMLLGDICLDPAGNVARLFPAGISRDVITYYTSCDGGYNINPFFNDITMAINYTAQIDILSSQITNICPIDPNLNQINPLLVDLTTQTTNFASVLLDCNTIYKIWNDGVNVGLCTDLFNSLFSLWIGTYILSGGLFFTCCFGIVLMEYYGSLWFEEGLYDPYLSKAEGAYEIPSAPHDHEIVDAGEVEMGSPPEVSAVVIPENNSEFSESYSDGAHMLVRKDSPPPNLVNEDTSDDPEVSVLHITKQLSRVMFYDDTN